VFSTVRTLVASAVFSIALFALTGSAPAMPAGETHDSGVGAAPVQTITEHSSSTSPAVWILGALFVLALAGLSILLVQTRRGLRPARG
jgi:hypothetical protein